MPEIYTWTILLINQLGEIGEKQLSVLGSRGCQICPLMHVPQSFISIVSKGYFSVICWFLIYCPYNNIVCQCALYEYCLFSAFYECDYLLRHPLNMFKPFSNCTCRSNAVLLLWIFFGVFMFYIRLSLFCYLVCSL